MRRRYIRIALLAGVPHWVIARALPPYDWEEAFLEAMQRRAFARTYGA
jgi:hypothetical protein